MKANLSARDLEALIALGETLNFSRASSRLNLSQSAYSSVISRIEEDVGVRLVDRSTRNVALTQAGEVYVSHARAILADMHRLLDATRDADNIMAGRIAVAAVPSLALQLVPQALRDFRARNPGIKVILHDVHGVSAIRLVRERRVDMAVIGADPCLREFRYLEIGREPFMVAMSERHPLADCDEVSFKQVIEFPQVSIARPNSGRSYLESAFIGHGLDFAPAREAEHLSSIGALLDIDNAVALLPLRSAKVAIALQGTMRRLVEPAIERGIGILRSADAKPSRYADAVTEILTAQARQLPWGIPQNH